MTRNILIATVLAQSGCFCGNKDNPPLQETLAAAMNTQRDEAPAAAGIVPNRQSPAAAIAQLERQRAEELDRAAVVPDELPIDLAAACDVVVSAYDEFMKRGNERDQLLWHDGRREKLGRRRAGCITQGNLQVAACQGVALTQEFPSLADLDRTEAAHRVLARCSDKFLRP